LSDLVNALELQLAIEQQDTHNYDTHNNVIQHNNKKGDTQYNNSQQLVSLR
jgi:hypothetical protein